MSVSIQHLRTHSAELDYWRGRMEKWKQGNHCLNIKELEGYLGTHSVNLEDVKKK